MSQEMKDKLGNVIPPEAFENDAGPSDQPDRHPEGWLDEFLTNKKSPAKDGAQSVTNKGGSGPAKNR